MAWDAVFARSILGGAYGVASFPSVPGTHLRLGTTAPTATVAMTELTGSGYTAGGQAITWSSPSGSPAALHNTSTPSWTNGGASAWAITGCEIWSTAGTPARISYAVWAGAPISIAPGNVFEPAISALSATEV